MQKWMVFCLFLILLVPCAWPQATSGTVGGTVRDQSGAVVPNATVTMVNTDTNVTSTTKSNEAGVYYFPGVFPGPYRLTVEVPGMQKFEGSFTVSVGQSVVIDPAMQVGQATARVEVQDVTPMVNVGSATVGTTLERSRIEQLPVNGRTMDNLLATIPGYENGRSYGSQEMGKEWILNGAVLTERRWGGVPTIEPGLDSVQEFVVESNAVSAKLSRPTNIMVSTKSGTNTLHGSLFETNRNNGLGLARARTDFYSKAPKLNRNEYGGSLGGPLVIPHVYNGKDRTFWFTSFEGQQYVAAATSNFPVPTAAMRNGDFSGMTDAQGRLSVIYDPWSTGANWSRTPYPGNVIPPNRQSPVSKYLLSITPLPTNSANPNVSQNWFGPQGQNYQYWQMNTRFDHRISDSDQFHAIFTAAAWNNPYLSTSGAVGQQMLNNVYGWETDTNYLKSASATWVHIISPSFSNELLLSTKTSDWTGGENDQGVNWPDKLGLPNPFNTGRVPRVTNLGLAAGGGSVQAFPGAPTSVTGGYQYVVNDTKENRETNFVFDDNLVKIYGKHEFLFGFHARRDYLNILPQQAYPQPQLNFGTGATSLYDPASTASNPQALPYTGANLANFYLGLATYGNNLSHGFYYLRTSEYAPYFQDNYKVTPRLTLNLGLRWEHWTPFHDKRGTVTGFSRQDHAVVLSSPLSQLYTLGYTYPNLVQAFQNMGVKIETNDQAGLSEDQVSSRWKNFGPRAGFAYKAFDGKKAFVLRGGYSIAYYNLALSSWVDNNRQNFPLAAYYSYNPNDTAQVALNDGLPNYMMRSVPTVVAGVNSTNLVSLDRVSGITPGCCGVTYFAPDQPDSRTHTWNLTAEKELFADTVLRVRYIGTHSSALAQNYNYNSSTPSFVWYVANGTPVPTGATSNIATRPYDSTSGLGSIQEFRKSGWANTNGFEAEIERRFNKGVAFQWSYTMINAFAATAGVNEVNQYLPGLVPTDYDARNKLLNYARDTGIPKHRVKWNWLIDLPVGRGKKLAGNSGKVLDKFIGGWQFAGTGNLRSTWFTLPTGNWNFTGEPVEVYGYQYPIQNCTSGVCIPGYLWTNAGYIPSNLINSHDAKGNPNGYEGIPASYKPAQTPLIPWGSTAMPANAPAGTNVSSYWDSNTVWIPLKNNTVQRTTYASGYNPWQNQYAPGILQWGLDASLFKVVSITERLRLRFNADFFNVLNHPGNQNNIGSNGVLNTQPSGQAPRTLQLSLRLSW